MNLDTGVAIRYYSRSLPTTYGRQEIEAMMKGIWWDLILSFPLYVLLIDEVSTDANYSVRETASHEKKPVTV
jgi:hypothetical protein